MALKYEIHLSLSNHVHKFAWWPKIRAKERMLSLRWGHVNLTADFWR